VDGLKRAGLPALWIPKRENIYLVDSIPVLGTGKVDLGRARILANDKVLGKEAAATGSR
jgi:acyl-[acyl-carrier-protein]-phospholipid O-acyltransferase/long-chain-fatty-acid--[acyl-carrier-protein] ligase